MKEERRTIFIPENYRNGIALLGMNFQISRIIEAIAYVAVVSVPVFFAMLATGRFEMSLCIGLSLSFSLPLGALCIHGIDGDGLTAYVFNALKDRYHRRTCLYNPRVKTEAVPYSRGSQDELLPRDRIIAMYNSLSAKADAKERSRIKGMEDEDMELVFREDEELKRKTEDRRWTRRQKGS